MSLVLIGAGGHAKVVAETASAAGLALAGVLTPEGEFPGLGLQRLGDDDWIDGAEEGTAFHIAFGPAPKSGARERLFERVRSRGLDLPEIVSPYSIVSPSAAIGAGSLVVARAVVNASAKVGDNCILNTAAIVEHGVVVGSHSHVGPGAILCGEVILGRGVIVGAGAVVLPGVRIADHVVVGAGSIVTRAMGEPGAVIWGAPGRRMR